MKPVIHDKLVRAITAIQKRGEWPVIEVPAFEIEYPNQKEHGDYATNVAMKLAKVVHQSPQHIGEQIKQHFDMDGIERLEIVAPGFINIFVNAEFLTGGVRYLLAKGEHYGQNQTGQGKTVLVEFLSANPTGPLHLGNGRGGFGGDTLVRVLRASGYDVIAEYYLNDYGNQLDVLAESVLRRYLQLQGINIDYPEELYKGEYIKDLAAKIQLKDVKLGNKAAMVELRTEVKDWAVNTMIAELKQFIEQRLGIHYDVWTSEKSLHHPANVQSVVQWLQEHNLIYLHDGATWFASTRYGDDKDRVIIKQTGETTYFFSDIVYLMDKFEQRKIDHWIWFLGADHHGYQGRMEAALKAIGKGGKLDIIFVQLVRLMFNGKELRMSKRKGTFVTLEELIDQVGLDVARWFFLMHEANTHMDFDLKLALEHSDQNPVYYVQYAHARICSVLAKIPNLKPAPLHFSNPTEEALAKVLFRLPELVEAVSRDYQIHHLPQYALEVARAFHKFYSSSRVIDNNEINRTRVQLLQATQIVLRNTLALMGINAPTKM